MKTYLPFFCNLKDMWNRVFITLIYARELIFNVSSNFIQFYGGSKLCLLFFNLILCQLKFPDS